MSNEKIKSSYASPKQEPPGHYGRVRKRRSLVIEVWVPSRRSRTFQRRVIDTGVAFAQLRRQTAGEVSVRRPSVRDRFQKLLHLGGRPPGAGLRFRDQSEDPGIHHGPPERSEAAVVIVEETGVGGIAHVFPFPFSQSDLPVLSNSRKRPGSDLVRAQFILAIRATYRIAECEDIGVVEGTATFPNRRWIAPAS